MAIFNGISIPFAYHNGLPISLRKIVISEETGGEVIGKSTLSQLNPYTLSQLKDKKLSEL